MSAFAVPASTLATPIAVPTPTPAGHTLSYLAHFGLGEAPFGLTPDTDFFFASPSHREALDTLRYALANGEGFIRIVGNVGTGKTLLCRTLLAELSANARALYLPNPALDPAGILLAVAAELGFELAASESAYTVQRSIETRLIDLAQVGIQVVLVIDEAQAMAPQSLETVRLLSNLESEKRKLLSIVLFGQPELDARLDAIPQFKTRISFHDTLRPLTRDELAAYLEHRLVRAGRDRAVAPLFSARTVAALHAASGGVPRIANVIAHKALMLAWARGLERPGKREVREATHDTLAARPISSPWLRICAGIALVVAGAVAGWLVQNALT